MTVVTVNKVVQHHPAALDDRFAACLAFTWRRENDGQPLHVTPGDRGGATAWGVTLASFASWRVAHRRAYPGIRDLARATKSELAQLIRANYWNAVQSDHLPPGVDLLVYDFGFGSGPATSVRLLQEVLQLTTDEQLGPATLAATRARDRLGLIHQLADRHKAFYESLADYPLFGKGWSRRNGNRLALAMKT